MSTERKRRLNDLVGGALVPFIEMAKAIPPEAPDTCQVKVVVLAGHLREAMKAGRAIIHDATQTPDGSILTGDDRRGFQERGELLRELLRLKIDNDLSLASGRQDPVQVISNQTGVSEDVINKIIKELGV